ncbi:lysophospholipid acyltransferase family protein [Rickettsiales bacterium]|nr:lysophospholipid acyltransferase family protein [Rickettsiales bacterium]
MKIYKRILSNDYVFSFICWFASIYIRFVKITTIWKIYGFDKFVQAKNSDKPIIIAFWHGRLLVMPALFKKFSNYGYVVVSHHKDGEIIARIAKFFGFKLIRGSSSKGGMGALKTSLRILKDPENIVVITPDGPRGPAQEVGGHIISIAQKSGACIIPVSYSTSSFKTLNSWDKFMLSLPFAKGALVVGDLIEVPLKASVDQKKKAGEILQNSLNMLSKQADELVN